MAIQKLSSAVQRKGQITIPQPLREAFGIQPGDEIYFKRAADGILLTTEKLERLARFNETLDELSALVAQREGEQEAPSLDALIEEVRAQRSGLLEEKYNLATADD